MKNNKQLHIRLEGADYEYLRRKALADDRSISYILRKIIKNAIAEQEKIDDIGVQVDNIKYLRGAK
jgi:predicted DNA-binding protein